MTPLDFVTHIDQYNTPIGLEMEARTENTLRIFSSATDEWVVSSYYYDMDKHCMVLEIEKDGDESS